MRKVLIIDQVRSFIEDVDMQLSFSFLDNADIVTTSDLTALQDTIEKEKPDEIVISASTLKNAPFVKEMNNVAIYSKSEKEKELCDEFDLPSYGHVMYTEDLVSAVDAGNPVIPEKKRASRHTGPDRQEAENILDEAEREAQGKDGQQQSGKQEPARHRDVFEEEEEYEPVSKRRPEPRTRAKQQRDTDYEYEDDEDYESRNDTRDNRNMDTRPDRREESSRTSRMRQAEREKAQRDSHIKKKLNERAAREQYESDTRVKKKKAHVVTVYSAKGGVGKTTISCEIATYLSLISAGKDRMRVCIADFNIDFGDVLVTLDLSEKGNTMKEWAMDIKEMIDEGHAADKITFTAPQIESYLQRNEKSGLYALLAPISNIDSMDITDVEIEVMLNNLINYGDFDFIICDTGNNTRDSTYLAIEKADDILLVMTQDINTANCNIKALDTLDATDLQNMDSIRLVINKVQPDKLVGISVEEIERYVKNPQTNERFETYAVIRDSNEVKNAENRAEPVVYNPNSDFTKAIGAIASRLIGDNFVLEPPKKKKRFRLFSKKE